jgi:hypothetical protein
VRDYVKAWVKANSIWTRIWRSNVIREERLDFYSEFSSEPRVDNGPGESSFSVVFEGRPTARLWKDWLVFFVGEVVKVFPEIRFERGSQDFKSQLLAQMDGKLAEHHSGELGRETADAKAERLITEELRRLGWQEADLVSRRKSDPVKLAIAARGSVARPVAATTRRLIRMK